MDVTEIYQQYDLPVYRRRNLVLTRGRGALVWDEHGKEYIDCVAGLGVALLGHAHPAVVEAIQQQSEKLVSPSNLFLTEEAAGLLSKLISIAPAGIERGFFCNSGAESVEAALKFARFSTGRKGVICAERAFHGRTMGALSATHKQGYREGFEPLLADFSFVPYNDFAALEFAAGAGTGAVLMEAVQGEGGVHPAWPGYLHQVQELCRSRGMLLIMDEVQTGLGRTGRMFASQHYGLEPDLILLAKGLAGGLPMGAALCSGRINMEAGKHGSTLGGNPLACRAALAVLRVLEEENLPRRAAVLGDRLAQHLAAAAPARVREVRHLGLMLGLELDRPAELFLLRLQEEEGVLALSAGERVIRLLPPLTISDEELERVAEALKRVLS